MRRRIVEQGGVTLMISLPRKWAKKYGLKKGDELELSERGKTLVLSTEKAAEKKTSAVVTIKDPKKFMGRLVFAPYRFGYNEVEIKYPDSSVLPQIQQCLDQLLGFEITEQGSNYLKIEMVAKELESEFEKMLRRILLMTSTMAKEMVEALKQNDKKRLQDIASMETTNNKLTNFCERVLNKHGYHDVEKRHVMYCTVWAIEQVVDELKTTCFALSEENVQEELIVNMEYFAKFIEEFTKLFYKHSYENLWTFREKYYSFAKDLQKIKAKNKTEFKVIALIMSVVEKLRHLTFSFL